MNEQPTRTPLSALWRVLFDDGPPPTRAALEMWLRDHGMVSAPGCSLAGAWRGETTPGLLDMFVWRLRELPRGHGGASLEDCHDHEIGDWLFGACIQCANKVRAQLEEPTWREVVAYVERREKAKEQPMTIKMQHAKTLTIPTLGAGNSTLTMKVEYEGDLMAVTFTAKKPGVPSQRDHEPAQSVDVAINAEAMRAIVTLLQEALNDRRGHEPGDK